MQGIPVFVYGTLLRGQCRFGVKTLLGVLHEEATLKGFRMLDLGSFPGLTAGEPEDTIVGEVHVFSSLDELDAIEGYSKENKELSLFVREEVSVDVSGESVEATVYIFNRAREVWDYDRIEDGNWRGHLERKNLR